MNSYSQQATEVGTYYQSVTGETNRQRLNRSVVRIPSGGNNTKHMDRAANRISTTGDVIWRGGRERKKRIWFKCVLNMHKILHVSIEIVVAECLQSSNIITINHFLNIIEESFIFKHSFIHQFSLCLAKCRLGALQIQFYHMLVLNEELSAFPWQIIVLSGV